MQLVVPVLAPVQMHARAQQGVATHHSMLPKQLAAGNLRPRASGTQKPQKDKNMPPKYDFSHARTYCSCIFFITVPCIAHQLNELLLLQPEYQAQILLYTCTL